MTPEERAQAALDDYAVKHADWATPGSITTDCEPEPRLRDFVASAIRAAVGESASEVADWLERCADTRARECQYDNLRDRQRSYAFADAYKAASAALRDGSWRKD